MTTATSSASLYDTIDFHGLPAVQEGRTVWAPATALADARDAVLFFEVDAMSLLACWAGRWTGSGGGR